MTTLAPTTHVLHKNYDIEVLRAVAVLMILVDHIKFLIPWQGITDKVHSITSLWGGVDVFFVISGFVITSMFLREPVEKRFITFAIPFWIRRIFRIWPSAVFWVLMVFGASLLVNQSGAFGDIKGNFFDVITVIMQVANLHQYHCTTGLGVCGVNSIYWSLSVEEQFYLLFPFLFIFVPRKHLWKVLLAFALILFFIPRFPHSFLWWVRMDALAWGALIALITGSPMHQALAPNSLRSPLLAMFVTVLFVVLIASFGTNMVIPIQTGLIAIMSAILVWIASYDKGFTFPNGPIRRFLLWAGSRSFALYLVHPFSYFATREIFFRLYPGTVFDDQWLYRFLMVGLGLTFVLAELNFRLLESPLRRKGVKKAAAMAKHIRGFSK